MVTLISLEKTKVKMDHSGTTTASTVPHERGGGRRGNRDTGEPPPPPARPRVAPTPWPCAGPQREGLSGRTILPSREEAGCEGAAM
jgi:hypothetical protein